MSAPIVVPAPEISARFDPRTGNTGNWLGADSARSVPLGDAEQRTVWLFADTYKRTSGTGTPTSRSGSTITSDSIAIQHGPNPATAQVTFHFATTPSGRWFPISDTHYSWPMDAIVIGNDLYVYSCRVLAESPMGGDYGWAIHKIPDAKILAVTSWVSTLLYASDDTNIRPGTSPYLGGDGFVYAFAIRGGVGWLWCRWTLEAFTGVGTQGGVTYYTGSAWSTDPLQGQVIADNPSTAEGSVHRRPLDGRWIITESLGIFPLFNGSVRMTDNQDANGTWLPAGTAGYHPPPPKFSVGDHVKVGGTYDAVIISVNSDGTRTIRYYDFWGGAIDTLPLADLVLKNYTDRIAYTNPRFAEIPLPTDYLTYAHKAHPSVSGPGLLVSYVDNGILGAPLDIYWPKFYWILPPTVTNLVVSDTGAVRWKTSGGPDRLMIRHRDGGWVEIAPTDTTYQLNGHKVGDAVAIRAIGIGGETVRSTNDTPSGEPRQSPEWSIHPRQSDLSRVHDPVSNWTKLTLVERYNLPDTWSVTGPAEFMDAFVPSGGSILFKGSQQIAAGKLTNLLRERVFSVEGFSTDTTTATFTSDLMLIGQRVVIPSPLYPMSTTAVFTFPDAYHQRTGSVETVMIDYIRAHAGDLAQSDRRVARLRLPASLGRGGTTQVSARFDQLGVLLQTLGEEGNLRITVKHTEDSSGSWLDVVIEPVADLSGDVRFGTAESAALGIITDWSYEIGAPTTSRAVVAGGGEMEGRDILLRENFAPEVLWGMSAETLVDQRQVPPLGDQSQITATAQLIQSALALANRSLAGDQRLREWIAGSSPAKTGQLGWSWLVEWDRLREADLTTDLLSDISREAVATVPENSNIGAAIDAARNSWSTNRQQDFTIRSALDDALKAAWASPPNELAHAAAIIQATNLIDSRNSGTFTAVMNLSAIASQYNTESAEHWNDRVASTFRELSRGGDEALESGSGLVRVKFSPTLGPDLEYRRDVRVGDIVGYDLPGLEPAKDKIREATTVVAVESGVPTETVTVVVGTPDAPTSRTQQQAARALRGITVVQRST